MNVERKNVCQPPEYTMDDVAEFFEKEKARALRLNKIEAIIDDDYDLDRLRELVEADKNKQVIIKPKGFYVGQEIFVIESEFRTGNPASVYRNWIKGFGENGVFYRNSPNTPVYFEPFENVGKTMFLDEEEAKKVLSKMKGENK